MDTVTTLLGQYDRLYTAQNNWREIWQELADYIIPRKTGFTSKVTPGTKTTTKLFDSAAIHANELLAASMNGTLTSQSIQWYNLAIGGLDLEKDNEANKWLELCAREMTRAFRQSNFYSEVHEVYLDLGALSTGCIYTEERDLGYSTFNGFLFKALGLNEYVIDEDYEGRVNTLFRKIELSAQAALSKWGNKAGEKVVKAYNDNKPDEIFEFLHGVFPREKRDRRSKRSINKPFASYYLSVKEKKIVEEGGYDEFPFAVPRWLKSSGEKYGRGPGMTALPDIRTLNKAKEFGLKAWAKAIDPPVKQLDDGVVGSTRLVAGGVTIVRDMNALEALKLDSRFDIASIKEEELRKSIREIFYSDQLQLQEGPQMTATEVYVRYELMQRLLGPTLGRLESEFLNPIIERCFNMMLRSGAFPRPPQSIVEFAKRKHGFIDIEYEGPLARAQRSQELMAIQKFNDTMAPMANVNPEVLDIIDTDAVARKVATVAGVPSDCVRSEAAVQVIRNKRNEEIAKKAQLEEISSMADAAGKAAPVLQMVGQGNVPASGGTPMMGAPTK